ncbi:MAG: anthranilate synthase component 2 [Paracoccaceae bacterium]|jgi:anthranilate synthase component 2
MIDNYDSFTYNLVQYLGELGQEVHVIRNDSFSVDEILKKRPVGIVIGPGPSYPSDAGICVELTKALEKTNIPLLGVCLGHQVIGEAFCGKVLRHEEIAHGKVSNIHHKGVGIFKNLESPFKATRYHSLVVARENFPGRLEITAELSDGTIMALKHKTKEIYGLQFHPESIASENGHALLKNFIKKIDCNINV